VIERAYIRLTYASVGMIIFRQVRKAEADWAHMYSIANIIPCMKNLKNTTSKILTAEQICLADEDIVKPVGPGFIKKYHHFTYLGPGVLSCKYIKGQGEYRREEMRQAKGIIYQYTLSDKE